MQILFARAEALHAHGHTQEASKLAVRLAHELLAHPPSLEVEGLVASAQSGKTTGNRRGRRFNPLWHQVCGILLAQNSFCSFSALVDALLLLILKCPYSSSGQKSLQCFAVHT